MSTQTISSNASSFSSSGWKFDVFLSFQGDEGTCSKKFTDHLCAAFDKDRFQVFKSDKELERGAPISTEHIKAIQEARFLVIVFSKTYALSTLCLDELVKIIECENTLGQTIIPVFYDVEPFVVRHQKADFEEVFARHEVTFEGDMEKVEKWRNALKEVANIAGLCIRNIGKRSN